jgi:hypothetical protein
MKLLLAGLLTLVCLSTAACSAQSRCWIGGGSVTRCDNIARQH